MYDPHLVIFFLYLSKYCEDKRDLLFAVFLNKSLIDDILTIYLAYNY